MENKRVQGFKGSRGQGCTLQHLCTFLIFFNISFLVLFTVKESFAANLSFDMGKNSAGVSAGRDFKFGYALLGISARFVDDFPWSYVHTNKDLNEQCDYYESQYDPYPPPDKLIKNCIRKGNFYDGDEWELFSKAGYRLPFIPMVYLNTGIGISRQRKVELYLFSEEYCRARDNNNACIEKPTYDETWGRVRDYYYMNLLGGLGFEVTPHMLINIDYHSRRGLLGGIMYRF